MGVGAAKLGWKGVREGEGRGGRHECGTACVGAGTAPE